MSYMYSQPLTPRDMRPGWNRYAIWSFILTLGSVILWIAIVIIAALVIAANLTHNGTTPGMTPYYPDATTNLRTDAYQQGQVVGRIISLVLMIPIIVGIILGHLGLRSFYRDLRGRGLAVAALVIGYIIVGIQVLGFVFGFIIGFASALH